VLGQPGDSRLQERRGKWRGRRGLYSGMVRCRKGQRVSGIAEEEGIVRAIVSAGKPLEVRESPVGSHLSGGERGDGVTIRDS
jgi:hypothetical protein